MLSDALEKRHGISTAQYACLFQGCCEIIDVGSNAEICAVSHKNAERLDIVAGSGQMGGCPFVPALEVHRGSSTQQQLQDVVSISAPAVDDGEKRDFAGSGGMPQEGLSARKIN